MKSQHQVILSIGSNQGNRLKNIENCIELVHKGVGTIIKVSRLFETPSWGFDSDSFYNCALLIHSSNSAQKILNQVLKIEKQLGRVRSGVVGYESRVIDIDMIAFDEEIINSDKLQVPHPLMQNRNFVLLPCQDLKLDWKHPIFKKTILELVEESTDKSVCKVVQDLNRPLQEIPLEQFNYVAFEGNIGAGKTTLANKIAEDFNAKTIL